MYVYIYYHYGSEQMAIDLNHDMKKLQEKQEALQETTTRIEELLMHQKSPVNPKVKMPRNLSMSLVVR